MSWSPDGRFLLYLRVGPDRETELWVLPLAGDRKPRQLDTMLRSNANAHLSPDGRWIVIQSNDSSGQTQVYVVPFALSLTSHGKWQVSTAGGQFPRWRRDGSEIFYLAPDNTLMSATVNGSGPAFHVSNVRPLFAMHASLLTGHYTDRRTFHHAKHLTRSVRRASGFVQTPQGRSGRP